jgi:hypothetical protein
MNKALTIAAAAGLGAGLMYLFDPGRGNRRRALIRDKVVGASHKAGNAIQATSCDLSHRAAGLVARSASLFKKNEEVSDDVLVERVRSKMGRIVSHPGAIEVTANDGQVTLKGPILAQEADRLISSVSSMRGVQGLDHQLERHEEAGDVPGLQGGYTRPGPRGWSPSTTAIVAGAGCALGYYGIRYRSLLGPCLRSAGLDLLARRLRSNRRSRRIPDLRLVFGR